MKKVLAFILCVAMVISCFAVASFAEDEKTEGLLAETGKCGDNVSWSFNGKNGTLVLSGKGITDFYYTTIDAYSDPAGLSPFNGNSEIKKVVVENGITALGDALFAFCENLTEIVIPESVVRIGKDVLLDTAIYKNVKNWDGKVLYYGNNIIAADKDIKGEYKVKADTRLIADEAFARCTELKTVKLNSELEYLGFGAFGGTGLENVTVPASIKDDGAKGADAFMDSALKSVEFEKGAKFVPASAFAGCTQLKTVKLPNSIEKIGDFAFYSCDSLEEFTVPEKVTELIGTFSLCKSLKTLNVPVSVKTIGMFALSESIKTINYAGTKAQWNKIDINSSNKKFVDNAVINYSVDFTPKAKNGLLKTESGWMYFKNDEIDYTFNALAKNDYGWWYIKNGTIDYKYEGLAENQYGLWYVKNGKIDFNCNKVVRYNGEWYYVVNGQVSTKTSGLIKCELGWMYFKNGKVDMGFEGLAKNQYGWWYILNGTINYKYKGLAKNDYGWWYVSDGKIDYNYQGLAKNQYGWWYVSNGKIDYNFRGLAKNDYGWWYVKNGKIDFTYNGTARNPYGRWNVVNGKVTTKAA